MSRIILKEYNSFHRNILKEFMSPTLLQAIDVKYTEAKIKRANQRINKSNPKSK